MRRMTKLARERLKKTPKKDKIKLADAIFTHLIMDWENWDYCKFGMWVDKMVARTYWFLGDRTYREDK